MEAEVKLLVAEVVEARVQETVRRERVIYRIVGFMLVIVITSITVAGLIGMKGPEGAKGPAGPTGIGLSVKPGVIVAWSGAKEPDGWLFCDGRPIAAGEILPGEEKLEPKKGVTSDEFAALLAVLEKRWARVVDEKPTRSRLPDLRGLFLRGADTRSDQFRVPEPKKVGTIQGDTVRLEKNQVSLFRIDGEGVSHDVLSTKQSDKAKGKITLAAGDETRPKNAVVRWIIKY